jgi:fatty acid synthase
MNGTKNTNGFKKVGKELIQQYLKDNKEEHVFLKIMDNILSSIVDENQNIEEKINVENLLNDIQNRAEFDITKDIINRISTNERFLRSVIDIVSENNVPKKEINVLEINLSNAIMATEIENYLACSAIYPIVVDYTIANKSIENLPEDYKNKSFKLIEWDHKKTSFPSDISKQDLIIYRDFQDLWDLKLDNFLQEFYDRIANEGFLLSIFRYKFTKPELVLNQIFKNNFINDSILAQRISQFIDSAIKIGFNVICSKSDTIGSMALLFRKALPIYSIQPKEQKIIEISDNFEKWLDVLKENVKKNNENEENKSNIWLIAKNSSPNGIIGLVNSLRQEPGGEKVKCIFDFDEQTKFPPNFSEEPFIDILINDLAVNVIRDGKLGTYRHLSLPKLHDKIESNDYFLNVGPNGDLSNLQWFELKNLAKKEIYINVDNRKFNQIRCNVYSTGLNFRDVMLASGIH